MYFLGCLFIDLIMSYIKLVKGKNHHKQSLKDINIGIYKVLFNEHHDYFLFDIDYDKNKDKLKYVHPRYRLNEYISYLIDEIIRINSSDVNRRLVVYDYMYCPTIISGNIYYDQNIKFVYEQKDKYKKIFYLEKSSRKYQLYDSNNDNIFEWYADNILKLEPNNEYIIYNFEKTIYGNIIYAKNKKNEINYYYINNKVMNILEKYFKSKKEDSYYYIYCTYNNYEARASSLTLITGDKIITDDGIKVLRQKLYLKDLCVNDLRVGYYCAGSYTFYINNHKFIDYKKEGRYNFLAMYIYNNDNQYNNLILGYEFKEKEYYYLKFEEKLILKNIDKEIAKNFEEMKKQDLYTYLLSNNEKRGMTISIDKDHNITYRLVKLSDDFFKSKSISTLDISLLKSQIVSEPCEINHFNGEVEDFDYKD